MQKNKVRILSTGLVGEVLVKAAAQHDIVIDEIPFITTTAIKSAALEGKISALADQRIAAVFTSLNAVDAVAEFIRGRKSLWKIFCIGNSTKKKAVDIFGKENILAVADSAARLAEKIIASASIREVVFFCGNQRRNELPATLKNARIEVDEIIVYKTIETPLLLSDQYDGILFFSPSAVRSFFSKNTITGKTQLFAIGATTGNAAKSFTNQPVIIAGKPGKDTLITMAIQHFSKTKTY
jgi:uroporphyrinogen-III synthase